MSLVDNSIYTDRNLLAKEQPQFNANFGLAGRYKFIRSKASSGEVAEESPWSDNLVTNTGKNKFLNINNGSGSQCCFHCVIGTGTSPPAVTDTVLSAYKAGVNSNAGTQSWTQTKSLTAPPYKIVLTYRWRFGLGVAAGNITEVGVAISDTVFESMSASTQLFSRALVRDAAGNPTAVTVLEDEYLDVIYELTVNVAASVTGNVPQTIKGVSSNPAYVMLPADVNNSSAWGFNSSASGTGGAYMGLPFPTTSPPYTSVYAATSQPDVAAQTPPGGVADLNGYFSASSAVRGEYVTNSFYRDFTFSWNLNYGNISGINCMRLRCYMVTFWLYYTDGSSFTKLNTDVLSVTIRISVS